ncbi:MAG: lamin tail domain-containing protein [Treponema sp.]|jgi:hypothetical protein|nr:lamin tail domain-containing protein [Treponema sp.]
MKSNKKKTALAAGIAVLFASLMLAVCSSGNNHTHSSNGDELERKLIILQAYGTGPDGGETVGGAVSHSFVELYNTTDDAINLSGYSLQYANGTSADDTATADDDWTVISLSGSIPAKASFLILGKKITTSPRHQFENNEGDINTDMVLSNRAFKVAVVKGTGILTVPNPFNSNAGGMIDSYVDMLGAINDAAGDAIRGYEENPAEVISWQKAARRIFISDTNDNAEDFESADYRISGMDEQEYLAKKPRKASDGQWDPVYEPEQPQAPPTTEGLMILQIGAATDGAISHSFVELYNNTDTAINLNSYSLQYADGTKVADSATVDGAWAKINLNGTIEPYHSFLILGNKGTTPEPQLSIEDGSGDMNEDFTLSNRAVKVALMSNQTLLAVQNPFDIDGEYTTSAGYIDMIGAENNATDQILGYEVAPARHSKQMAPRRAKLTDNNNNQEDFTGVDYSTLVDMTISRPKNHAHGAWDPRNGEPGKPAGESVPRQNGPPEGTNKPPVPTGNTLLIFQIGAATDGNISHSFVELYNKSDVDVSLNNYSLQYAAGYSTNAGNGAPDGNETTDGTWEKIDLTGKTIKAHSSFLILGRKGTAPTPPALLIADNYGDINDADFVLNNRALKVALMSNQTLLTVQNPYNTDGKWAKAAGYVDMVGAINTAGTDYINGFEQESITDLNKQAGQRRKSLTDSDNNKADFARAVYDGATVGQKELWRPKNSAHGEWDPFADPVEPEPPEGSEMLMILQIGAATDGNISHSFVELYNNTNAPIDLSGYSLQYAAGFSINAGNGAPGGNTTTDGGWNKIDLSGIIQPRHSFLILGSKGTNAAPALSITDNYGDMNEVFIINNRCFKVALMSNTTLLTVQNPFDTDGSGTETTGYVDMVGALNTPGTDYIQGYETNPIIDLNKQTGQRRKTLTDTDDNKADFARAVYDGATADEKELRRPKNLAYGAWNPITGEKD